MRRVELARVVLVPRGGRLHYSSIATTIQIRDVPEALHRELKSRAALAGISLSGYLLEEIRRIASQLTVEELRARLARRSAVDPAMPPAEAVRAERDPLRSQSRSWC